MHARRGWMVWTGGRAAVTASALWLLFTGDDHWWTSVQLALGAALFGWLTVVFYKGRAAFGAVPAAPAEDALVALPWPRENAVRIRPGMSNPPTSAESTWIDGAAQRLLQAGYTELAAPLPGIRILCRTLPPPGPVTRSSLHVYVVLATAAGAGGGDLRQFTHDAVAWSTRHAGQTRRVLPPVLAVLPVLVVVSAGADVRRRAARRHGKRGTVYRLPVLVELAEHRGTQFTTYTGLLWQGLPYTTSVAQQQELLRGELSGQVIGSRSSARRIRRVLYAALIGSLAVGVLLAAFLLLA